MMRPVPLSLSLLMSIAWSASALADMPSDPVAVAQSLYAGHHDFYVADAPDAAVLSPQLLALLQRDWRCQAPGDECAISADPWTAAQEGEALPPVRYRLHSDDAGQAIVEMRYPFGWADDMAAATEQKTLVVLVRGKSGWLLDDLRVGGQSLSKILRDYDY